MQHLVDSTSQLASHPHRAAGVSPRVLLAGKLTGMIAPGGGEVQLLALTGSLPEVGVDARIWRPWEESLADCDCLHLFGSEPEHLTVVAAARRQGIPVVLSTVAWFDWQSLWREPWPLRKRLFACGKFLARATLPKLPEWRRRLYDAVDLLLPNSQVEARQLQRHFAVPAEKLHVVPNGADPRFATADPDLFQKRFGLDRFVLYPGRIEPRKNQLAFLRSLHGSNIPLVILGDAVPGHERYLNDCHRAADHQVHFVGRLDHADPLLASAYAAASCVALCSWYETPGLVALEAGMLGTPLVLPKIGACQEYFGSLAAYVGGDDLREIRETTLRAVEQGPSAGLARLVQSQYSWRAAALATKDAYAQVL
jgi:glycosyltransferase involved in cell wall biosynthesis